ncbi:ergothioneine biosynthesis protein EgtB [Cellulophaga baltica]|uniref:Sulfatase maturase n=1 Tax=Cellulophaga baltica 18 TaxID=1348584 RepID=A0AAU8S0Y5_9FLAO|nr:ergothioneine biosynthesis protein EgtB [Cellulophaga baltica]AIZ43064.1 sulfatase maturase [Cellulophaga baltica 18]
MTNYELIYQFEKTRAHSVALCAPLAPEDYNAQPVAFASPPKWHLAHITWFFEEMILKKYDENYVIFNKDFSYLFNSYYQTVGERAARSLRGAMTRPLIEEIYSYRTYVDQHIVALLKSKLSLEIETLVTLGIQHEQQHQELLLTDLKHTFSFNPLHPIYHEKFNLVQDTNKEEGWLAMPEGIYEIGHQGDGFCFDNELGRHKVFLHDYQLSKGLVTNGDFIAFIAAGGYQEFKYWLDEGWSWVQEEKITAPLYWIQKDGTWFYYTLAGLKPVDVDAILSHVSFYEAQAFATFKNMRLPTEFEWEAASEKFNWGKRWEWTYSAYLPYPNFKIADGAVGEYNGKFMINTMVLRGSSVATSEGHERNTYRNFFHPKYRWQYTGIRLAK